MRKLLAALCVIAVVVFLPWVAYAAQTSRTLQPGNVYEFTGRDARVISHINSTTATGRYDIVAWDAQGNITRFGSGIGRISVSGAGGVAISPHVPLPVTFDSARLNLAVTTGHVFREINLAPGQTVSITNNYDNSLHIRTAQRSLFDHVISNHLGVPTSTSRESRLPQISIPASSSIAITAIDATRIYFPRRLDALLHVATTGNAAIESIPLLTGQVYTLTNISNATRSFNVAALAAIPTFSFEYVMRGGDGHVTSHGIRNVSSVQLLQNQSITITPLMNGELVIPYTQLEYLRVEAGVLTPMYRTLSPGYSLTIENSDLGRSHNVFIRCPENENGFVVDYAIIRDGQVTVNTLQAFPGGGVTISLPPSSQTTITIIEAETHLAISLPNIDAITAIPSLAAASSRIALEPGRSVYITNLGEDTARVLPLTELANSTAVLDFVRYYDGDIIAFGTSAVRTSLLFEEGQSALITNASDEVITLHIPTMYLQNGLELEEAEAVALMRREISSPLQIENRDRLYHHSFLVQNETNRTVAQGANVFEYVRYTTSTNIVAFGERGLGSVEVPASQRLVVAPIPNGIVPTLVFPAEWYGSHFRISNAVEAPLHRMTLIPGRSVTINNFTQVGFVMQNNSAITAAGYIVTVTPPGEMRRELLWQDPVTGFREYTHRFVREVMTRGTLTAPAQGPIELPPQSEIIITATPGANLELLIPRRWARQLMLIR